MNRSVLPVNRNARIVRVFLTFVCTCAMAAASAYGFSHREAFGGAASVDTQASVYIDNASGNSGASVTIPVKSSSVAGLNAISAQFTFSFDRTVLSRAGGDLSITPGTMIQRDGNNVPLSNVVYNVVDDANIANQTNVYVTIYGAYPFVDGSGDLVNIHTKVVGSYPQTSALTLADFLYNGGRVTTSTTSGVFSVNDQGQSIIVDTAAPATAEYLSNFNVSAHATSGLAVAITTTGSCSGSGSGSATISMTASTGNCTVHYNQPGDGSQWFAAPEVTSNTAADKASTTTSVSFGAGPFVYNGSAFTATASVSGPGPFTQSLTPGYSGDCTNVTSPNGCTATATFAGSSDYKPSANTASITITPATPTVTTSGGSFAYDGSGHASTGSAKGVGNVTVSGSFAYTYTPPGDSTVPVNAGSYGVSAAFTSGDPNYSNGTATNTITITAVDPNCTVTGYSGAFDGQPHGASGTCKDINGNALSGLDLGSPFTNVPGGTANWTFTSPSANYNSKNGSVQITITAVDPNCTVSGGTFPYDGQPHGATGTCKDINGNALSGLDLGGTFTNVPGGTANWTFTSPSANYNSKNGSVQITITAVDPNCTVTGYSGAYDGQAHGATGTCKDINGNALSGLDLGGTFTNVPGGTASWTFTSVDSNYNSKNGSANIVITAVALTVTADADPQTQADDAFRKPFDGSVYTGFTVRYNGFVNGETSSVLSGSLTFSGTGTTATAAGGPYTVTPGGLTATNYAITFVDGALYIDARTLSGKVQYGNAANGTVYIPGATVSATGTPSVTSTTSDSGGSYQLSGFGTSSYTVSASKAAQGCAVHNGVIINDASLIAQYLIHLIPLNATQLQAANVSDSPQVTAYDASLIAQYVICMSNPDSHAGEWRFSSYTNTIAPTDTHDFSGILKGDVDGDWAATPPPVQSLAANALGMDVTRVSVPELAAQQGSQVTVPLRIDNLNGKGVVAYQFDIAYDPSVLGTTPNGRGAATLDGTLSNGLTVLTNSPEPGLLKVAVYGAIPATGGDGVYLKLGFTAQGNAGTTSPLAINAFMLNDARTQVLAQNGSVTVQAASGPAFNGRVLSASGAPIANARIAVRSASGQLVTMLSNSFGYVYIGGLEPGQSYTMTTTAKGFTFRPVTLSATSGLTQMDIVANQ